MRNALRICTPPSPNAIDIGHSADYSPAVLINRPTLGTWRPLMTLFTLLLLTACAPDDALNDSLPLGRCCDEEAAPTRFSSTCGGHPYDPNEDDVTVVRLVEAPAPGQLMQATMWQHTGAAWRAWSTGEPIGERDAWTFNTQVDVVDGWVQVSCEWSADAQGYKVDEHILVW